MVLPVVTLEEAREAVRVFNEVYILVPAAGQIRLLVADGIPAAPVRLLDVVLDPEAKWGKTGTVWLVERLDTGEQLRVVRGTLKRQLTEMEVIAWAAR